MLLCCAQLLQLCPTLCNLWTVASQAPLSMGISRQEYWSGLLCPPPGDLPDPGTEPVSPASLALRASSLPTEPLGKPIKDTTSSLLEDFYKQWQVEDSNIYICYLAEFYLILFKNFFYWNIVDLQCCFSFRSTESKCNTYADIHSF